MAAPPRPYRVISRDGVLRRARSTRNSQRRGRQQKQPGVCVARPVFQACKPAGGRNREGGLHIGPFRSYICTSGSNATRLLNSNHRLSRRNAKLFVHANDLRLMPSNKILRKPTILRLAAVAALTIPACLAAEGPFFITYTHQMEEPGNLEIATNSVTGQPASGNRFFGAATEFEYGLKAWWTTEVYLDGQTTLSESAIFAGYRWENRFRLLPREHWINPVLYVEFENINGADKSLLEVVGHDGKDDITTPNDEARLEKKREGEMKLILSSSFRDWNISENFIAEKNFAHEPWEF